MTRLTSTGEKGITYVPAGRVVQPRQTVNSNNQPVVEWTHTDAVGVSEQGTNGLAGYDPLGNYSPLPQPPPSGGGASGNNAVYAPNYNWSPSSFTNFGNLSTGCMFNGRPESCDKVARELNNGGASVAPNSPAYTPGNAGGPIIQISTYTVGVVGHWTNPENGRQIDRYGRIWSTEFFAPGSQLEDLQKPVPQPLPTPTPEPQRSAEPIPDPYRKDCMTYQQLIDMFKAVFDKAWEMSSKSSKENGGWIFYDNNTNLSDVYWASEGSEHTMPNEPKEFAQKQRELLNRDDHVFTFVLEFHVHPSGYPEPSGANGDVGNIYSTDKQMYSVRPIGIVIYGPGKYTLYDEDGKIADSKRKLSECVKVRTSRGL